MSLDLSHLFNLIGLKLLYSNLGMILRTIETKAPKKSFPVKCDNCQGYGHRVDTCVNFFLRVVIIVGVPTTTPKLYIALFFW